jgi:hypothetical protein
MPAGDNDLGTGMSGKWFTNRGQIIQVALTALAFGVAVIVSLPALKEHKELLDWLPFLFLALTFYGTFQLGRIFPKTSPSSSLSTTNAPVASAPDSPYRTSIEMWSPTIRAGTFWEGRLSLRKSRITVIKVIDGETPTAELRFEGGVFHGLAGVRTKDFQTFLLRGRYPGLDQEANSVFSFDFREGLIEMFAARIDHINTHTNEVTFIVCSVRASNPDKI